MCLVTKNNAAAGYMGPVKIELRKGAGLLSKSGERGVGLICENIFKRSREINLQFSAETILATATQSVTYHKKLSIGRVLVILLQVWWIQRPPQDYKDKLINLQRFVNPKKKQYDSELCQIGNAEQTPLT